MTANALSHRCTLSAQGSHIAMEILATDASLKRSLRPSRALASARHHRDRNIHLLIDLEPQRFCERYVTGPARDLWQTIRGQHRE